MKVKLYAKRLDNSGHVYLNTIEVPQGTQEWKIPVSSPVGAWFEDGGTIAPASPHMAARVFRMQYDPLGKAINPDMLPRFLEM